jgi:hypothetical protein
MLCVGVMESASLGSTLTSLWPCCSDCRHASLGELDSITAGHSDRAFPGTTSVSLFFAALAHNYLHQKVFGPFLHSYEGSILQD